MNKKLLLFIFLITEITAILFMLFYKVTPPYTPDSASYIEQARYLRQGKGLVNSPFETVVSVENDLEPAKLFPPGYPIMAYSLELFGIDEKTARILAKNWDQKSFLFGKVGGNTELRHTQ